MKLKTIRKWNRNIHRDLGYFFFGMTVIYALSGIALNHIDDWNPNFIITNITKRVDLPQKNEINKEIILRMLATLEIENDYKKHYFPDANSLKVFLHSGNIVVDLSNNRAEIELLRKRPVFNQMNFLHYNPKKWWTWFADIFGGALLFLAFSGLFILRGKNGIKGRGAWLTIAGIILPVVFLIFFR